VWALPVHGEESDFQALVQGFVAGDPSQGSWLARALWTTRWKIGELLGWDEAQTGLGKRVPTLRERLPEDLLDAAQRSLRRSTSSPPTTQPMWRATQTGGTLVSCDIQDLVSKGLASTPATPFQQMHPG
jgi:hypothetical protein